MRSRTVALLVAACFLLGAGAAVPVHADSDPVGGGGTTLAGTLSLPAASCLADPVPCVGSFSGRMEGAIQGVQDSAHWEALWRTLPDDVTATVDDWEVACAPTGAVVTRARGTGSAVIEPAT